MEPIIELKTLWNDYKSEARSGEIMSKSELNDIIVHRMNREKSRVVQYFWAALVYQIIIYSLLSFTLFRYGSHGSIPLMIALGLLLNIPYTIFLIRRFRNMYSQSLTRMLPKQTIKANIERYQMQMTSFFRWKKWADRILIPGNAFIAVLILFSIYADAGAFHHIGLAIFVFSCICIACLWAVHVENKNRFKKPIRQIADLLKQFDSMADQP